jgi:hypothetical protein
MSAAREIVSGRTCRLVKRSGTWARADGATTATSDASTRRRTRRSTTGIEGMDGLTWMTIG